MYKNKYKYKLSSVNHYLHHATRPHPHPLYLFINIVIHVLVFNIIIPLPSNIQCHKIQHDPKNDTKLLILNYRLLSLGVIEQVDEPTQWCAPIVVASCKAQGIWLCVDLSQLNESVMHERHVLPYVDQVLAQLAGAQVFSKLDCYNAFLKIPLALESRHLTTLIDWFVTYAVYVT